jgi:hypothetical protein
MNPLQTLLKAIEKVPYVKYALGIAGIFAAIAIIKTFGVENFNIPVISILIMLGLMVLLFIFSRVTNSKDRVVQTGGYILIYTTIAITCLSCFLLASSVFFDYPKPISEYGIFKKDTTNKNVISAPSKDTVDPDAPIFDSTSTLKDTIAFILKQYPKKFSYLKGKQLSDRNGERRFQSKYSLLGMDSQIMTYKDEFYFRATKEDFSDFSILQKKATDLVEILRSLTNSSPPPDVTTFQTTYKFDLDGYFAHVTTQWDLPHDRHGLYFLITKE